MPVATAPMYVKLPLWKRLPDDPTAVREGRKKRCCPYPPAWSLRKPKRI
jgi:hypothetical protein